jgi:hypothetical protein
MEEYLIVLCFTLFESDVAELEKSDTAQSLFSRHDTP